MNKDKICFVTMFPRIENIHLIKDVGMIPYSMKKYYGFNSKIVIYKNGNYPYLNEDTFNLPYLTFPLKKFNSKINCILFLIKNAKKIDVLNLFHISQKTTWVSILVYFFMNHNGLVYVHMDSNLSIGGLDFLGINNKKIKTKIKVFLLKKFIFTKKNISKILFGVQNKNGASILNNIFPFQNIKYIPDGYEELSRDDRNIEVKKENTIIFVGRVGTQQKRTDILLDGFIKAYKHISNWKLKIIGPIEENFYSKIEIYRDKYPKEFESIEFTGPIMNREKLKLEYKKAKIFCLPSDYESFGLVLVEALYNGCTIISSDILSSIEILEDEKYGYLFRTGDSDSLCDIIIKTCRDKDKIKFVSNNGCKYIVSKYSYNVALKPLSEWIINKRRLGDENEGSDKKINKK